MTATGAEPRILIVEDDAETQMLLRHLLASNYDVVVTGGIGPALDAARRQCFDLYLLDIRLGNSNSGADLLDQLRAIHDRAASGAESNGPSGRLGPHGDPHRDADGGSDTSKVAARRVPALAVTAQAMPGDKERILDQGFDRYLAKPFSRGELLRSIERTLEGGGVERGAEH